MSHAMASLVLDNSSVIRGIRDVISESSLLSNLVTAVGLLVLVLIII